MMTLVRESRVLERAALWKTLAGHLTIHGSDLRFESRQRFRFRVDVDGMAWQQRVTNRANVSLHAIRWQVLSLLDLSAQIDEELALRSQDVAGADRTMSRRDDRGAKRLCFGERLHPGSGIAVGQKVVRPVECGSAAEQNLFFRQPCEAVAVGMRGAKVAQLDAVLPVVKDHHVAIEQRRRFETRVAHILALFRFVLPAAGFSAEEP